MKIEMRSVSGVNSITEFIAVILLGFGLFFVGIFISDIHQTIGYIVSAIGFLIIICWFIYSSRKGKQNKERIQNLFLDVVSTDTRSGPFAGGKRIVSDDTGDTLLISEDTQRIQLYQSFNEDSQDILEKVINGVKTTALNRDEIKNITIDFKPTEVFGENHDGSVLSPLPLAGALVGGVFGLVVGGVIASESERLKEGSYTHYYINIILHLHRGESVEFRAIKRSCGYYKTSWGQQALTDILDEVKQINDEFCKYLPVAKAH